MRRAFTLIELLVVIAIISILASMLLPALGQAKLRARLTACMARQGDLSKAMMMYEGDQGYFPYSGDGLKDGSGPLPGPTSGSFHWCNKVYPYVLSVEIFAGCRSAIIRNAKTADLFLDADEGVASSYGSNFHTSVHDTSTRRNFERPTRVFLLGHSAWPDYDVSLLYNLQLDPRYWPAYHPEVWSRGPVVYRNNGDPYQCGYTPFCFVDGHAEFVDYWEVRLEQTDDTYFLKVSAGDKYPP